MASEEKPLVVVTCTAPVNIAVIKYWGKRDEDLVLPINSSLSVTLHQDQLKTTTTAAISKDFTEDRIWLNGREEDVGQPRLQACLRESEWDPAGDVCDTGPSPSFPSAPSSVCRVRVHRGCCWLRRPPGEGAACEHGRGRGRGGHRDLPSPRRASAGEAGGRGRLSAVPLPPPDSRRVRCQEQVGATCPVAVSPPPSVRRLARKRRSTGDEDPPPLSLSYKVHVASVNNFPTAAGLASSAAGYACLAYALARVYGVDSDLSEVARRGSGSACRSLYGGFVEWQMGERADGKDSVARQVAPESHWPALRVLILVVSAERKLMGSTAGMQTSVETSPLLRFRAEAVVPGRMVEMAHCVRERDFQGFGRLTMKDSNQFHATCLDTFPPISYLSDISRRIIRLVHCFNAHHGQTKVAYTFDAGPNAVVFTLDDTVPEFVAAVRHCFPPESNGDKFLKGLPVRPASLSDELRAALDVDPTPGGVKYIIATQVGPGPQTLDDPHAHLLGPDGLPKPAA
ncbi:diphosphomevalonate decarboxylase isoform X1 [Prionailurus bengalensis]|uniref:diphosphomevalonate decarboxylase isoform X1 n=1 Tax=Prionailurus bengalensis TaxID=37029 RepID=UPI001CA81F43|nr:diphosphomevalonate decarboxylase isoform X1 [Prionailurus bengalensis]